MNHDSWMVLKSIPREGERSIGQELSSSRGFPKRDGVLAMMEMLTIHVIRCCVHCRSIENEYPLCAQGRGERWEGRCCSPHSCARPLSLSRALLLRNYEESSTSSHLSPLPCAQRGVIFNGSAWWETTKNYLYYQHPILAGVGET